MRHRADPARQAVAHHRSLAAQRDPPRDAPLRPLAEFTGALAIGAAIVLDRDPLTRWPEALTTGVHYVPLGTETGKDQPLAPDAQYAAIPAKIEEWLADEGLAARIGRTNAEYYDRFVDPSRVGEHIVGAVERFASGS